MSTEPDNRVIAAPELDPDKPVFEKVTNEDREAFYKAFLADRPFEKRMPIFGGRSQVVFKVLTNQENTEIYNQVKADNSAEVGETFRNTIVTYRLAKALVSLDADTDPFQLSKKPADKPDLKHALDVVQSWSVPKLAALLNALAAFDGTVLTLTKSILSEDF